MELARAIATFLLRLLKKHKFVVTYGLAMFALGIFTANVFSTFPESKHTAAGLPPLKEITETSLPQNLRFAKPEEKTTEHTVDMVVKKGDTFSNLLIEAGIDRRDAHFAGKALKGKFDLRSIGIGQKMTAVFTENEKEEGDLLFTSLIIEKPEKQIVVNKTGEESFKAEIIEKTLERKLSRAGGTIESSLFQLAEEVEIPHKIIMEAIRAYSYDVDFQRDVRKGQRFEVLYETFFDEQGNKVRDGNMLFATLTVDGKDMPIYYFTPTKGDGGYYNVSGRSIRKALLKTPVDGARISSRYGYRKHPILGYNKLHKGVDFAAPRGTPVFAAGDGKINKIGRNGGYGKYIRIRHNSTYSTAYAHLHRYAKGMKRGRKVKQGQVIGYVGSTGRSTGPHLHYEILQNGKQANPLKVKMTPGKKLSKTELARYEREKIKTDTLLASIPLKTQLAFRK